MKVCPKCGNGLDLVRDASGTSLLFCEQCRYQLAANAYRNPKFNPDRRKAPTVINENTGEGFKVDRVEARVKRLRNRVWTWADTLKGKTDNYVLKMVTLTYAPDVEWEAN